MKLYEGIYWEQDAPNFIGIRFEFWAIDLLGARKKFEEIYGENKIYSLHNEEEANTIRYD